jgi:glutaconate CoA-transferase subunit B
MATACHRIFIVMPHSRRAMVERLDFVTSLGHGDGGTHRQRMGITTAGPERVITDLCVMEPDPITKELIVTSLHPGVSEERVREETGWPVRFASPMAETDPPASGELEILRALRERTARAHAGE